MIRTCSGAARRGVLAAGAGAALLLAACSSGSAAAPATSPVGATASASATAAASASAGPSASVSATGAAAVTSANELATRVAAATRAKRTAHLSFTSQTKGQAATVRASGLMRIRSSATDVSFDMGADGQKLSFVLVQGVFYVKLPQAVAGKPWLRIAPGGSDPISKSLGPLLQSLGSNSSLSSQLGAVNGARITSTETTTVDGAPATRYTLALTEKNYLSSLDALPGLSPAVKRQAARSFKGARGTEVITVDAQDLVRELASTVTTATGGSTTTITYSDWGKPVSITAPAASQVTDPSKLG